MVATLVFCSVCELMLSLREIWRVLKPGGTLLLREYVRAQGKLAAWVQDALVPVTTCFAGNCHWNRDTRRAVLSAGFFLTKDRKARGGLLPC